MSSWIVQGSGEYFCIDWYLDEYARTKPNEPDWWIIYKKHLTSIKKGDTIYIWKAEKEPLKRLKPEYYEWKERMRGTEKLCGIIAIGKIISDPVPYYSSKSELEKFKKYRVVPQYNFDTTETKTTYKVDCIYEKPANIRVRNPLLQEIIWENLGKTPDTELGIFNYKRRGTRSVELTPEEAKIIKALLEKPNIK